MEVAVGYDGDGNAVGAAANGQSNQPAASGAHAAPHPRHQLAIAFGEQAQLVDEHQINPDAAPEFLSALRNSAVLPSGVRIMPGDGVRINSTPCRSDASAMALHCPRSSPIFSLVSDTAPIRVPGLRSGPARMPLTNMAIPAVLLFFLAVLISASVILDASASARKSRMYQGITIG